MTSSHTPSRRRWWPWRHRDRDASGTARADEARALPAGRAQASLSAGVVLSAHGAPDAASADVLELDIARGSFTALVGGPGSGVTTVIRLLSGLETPPDIVLRLDGRPFPPPTDSAPIGISPRRPGPGLLFRRASLVPSLTVRQNILLPAVTAGLPVSEERLAALTAMTTTAGLLDRRPGELTGDEQQRVALARALITDPAVLLAEDPVAGLDPADARALIRLLRGVVSESGRTVVLSTDDADLAAAADRVLVLAEGRIVHDLRPSSSEEIRALLRGPDADAAAGAPRDAAAAEDQHVQATDHSLPTWRIPQADRRIPVAAASVPVYDDDPRTQEIALLAVEQVRAIDQATARSAAAHDALREELGAEAVQASLNRLSPGKGLPADSARVVDEAQRILGDLPGPIMPEE